MTPAFRPRRSSDLVAHRLDLRRLFDSLRVLLRRDLSLRRQWMGERRCRHQSGSAHEQHAQGERETYTAAKRPTEWRIAGRVERRPQARMNRRSEEHTSELQSLMRISYAVFCLKKKNTQKQKTKHKAVDRTKRHTTYIRTTCRP